MDDTKGVSVGEIMSPCYRAALYPSLLRISPQVRLSHHVSVSGARGRVIVGTHRLVVEPSVLSMPRTAWLLIVFGSPGQRFQQFTRLRSTNFRSRSLGLRGYPFVRRC